MTIAKFFSDLQSRNYKPLYLLHGEEPYYIDLISHYMETSILTNAEKDFDQTVLYGKDIDALSLINHAKQYPMMSAKRVVLVKEAQAIRWPNENDKNKELELVLNYLHKPSITTILVLCYKHTKLDKRTKIYKAIAKNGFIFESNTLYQSKIPGWIDAWVREKGHQIDPNACTTLAEYLGNDLSKIANELKKLSLNLNKGQPITLADVQDNISASKDYTIFELQHALAHKNIVKANQIIGYFSANPRENSIELLLGALSAYFAKLLKLHYLNHKPEREIGQEIGVHNYFMEEYQLAKKNYPLPKVFEIFDHLRDCDLYNKGIGMSTNTPSYDLIKELIFKIMH